MALYDVYVEGATDGTPQATQRLAEVMSQRYGLPAVELVARLSKGRFRVKANLDEATAQTYLRDLEAIGARVALTEARGASTLPPPTRPKPVSTPPPHPITVPPRMRNESKGGGYSISRNSSAGIPLPDDELARSGTPSTPPPVTPRTLSASALPEPAPVESRTASSPLPPRSGSPSLPPASSPLPPRTQTPSLPPPASPLPPRTQTSPSMPPANTPFASGLSAAYADSAPVPDASAFDSLSLAAVDDAAANAQLEPSPVLAASIGPAVVRAPASKTDRPKDVPVDLFAPPEAQSDDFKVELAVDDRPRERTRTPANAIPAVVPPSPSTPVLRPKASGDRSAGVRLPSISDDTPRWRFAAGVLVSVVLGFVPATLVHSCREGAAFEKIDNHVATVQQQAATTDASPVPFAKLDEFRDEQIANKKSERRNIAIVSMLIWGLAGAGIGYVWFRRVPWDKIKFGS